MASSEFGFGSPYRYWANCGLGSSVTAEDVKEIAPGMRFVSTTSMTLCALEPGKATVDLVVRNRVEGGPIEFPPTETLQEVEIPAGEAPGPGGESERRPEAKEDETWGLGEAVTAPWPDPEKDPAATQGEDTLQIAGRPIVCRWAERTVEIGGRRLTVKAWMSDQIPGGRARFEVRGDGDSSQDLTTVVVAFVKK